MKFAKRAQELVGSSTMAATILAQEKIKHGENIIIGTIGEPDCDIPTLAKEEAIQQLQTKKSRYGSPQGVLETRMAVAQWMSSLYRQNWTEENVVIAPGSKFALYSLFQILCDPGDRVLIPAPYWVSYASSARLADAEIIIAPCDSSENYKLSAEKLSKYLNEFPNIKIFILNSPNNPTGAVYTLEELKALASVIEKNPHLIVICDDIYNQLVFSSDNRSPHLFDVIAKETFERIIIVHGASKSFALTGWRLGWTIAPPRLTEKLVKFQSQILTCVPDFLQWSLIPVLQKENSFVINLKNEIMKKHQLASKLLKHCPSIKVFPSDGAFYLWLEVTNPTVSSEILVKDILSKSGIALVPGSSFGMENHLRFSVTLPEDILIEGTQRLINYFSGVY